MPNKYEGWLKLIKLKNENIVWKEDSKGRKFKYVIESVSDKIVQMVSAKINESNWGRIIQHIDNGCMMISACRGDKTEEENAKRTDQLAKDIRESNLGYIRILGGYIENKGTDNEKEVTEESFFVPKNKNMSDEDFFDIAIKLCKKYNQDSVLVSLPKYTDFGYYDKNGDFDFSPGEKFIANDKNIGEYFSALVYGPRSKEKFAFSELKTEWLAVRHPSSSYQAAYMSKMNEYF